MDEKKQRQSNWELMRIISMFLLVVGHFTSQCGFFLYAEGLNRYLGLFIGNALDICANLFLFLGVWFMVDSTNPEKRIIRIYFNTWTYTFSLALLVLILGFNPPIKYVFTGIFPFVGKNMWFVSTYIGLLLLHPWLKKIFLLPKKSLEKLLIVLTFLISGFITFWAVKGVNKDWINGLVWFVYSYIFIGWYKKYCPKKILNKYLVLSFGIIIYLFLVYLPDLAGLFNNENISKLANALYEGLLVDYKAFPNFVISMCIFYFFRNLEIGYNKVINYIASGAFATYVIHQTHAFRPILWQNIMRCDYFFRKDYALLYCIVGSMAIYAVSLLIERLRIRYLEKLMLECKPVKWIENNLGKWLEQ